METSQPPRDMGMSWLVPTHWSLTVPESNPALGDGGTEEMNPFTYPGSCVGVTGAVRSKWCHMLAKQQPHLLA